MIEKAIVETGAHVDEEALDQEVDEVVEEVVERLLGTAEPGRAR